MTWFVTLVMSAGWALSPTYTLDHLDVAMTLPDGAWRLRRWSGDALNVDLAHPAGEIRLAAWGTPLQVPIIEGQSWTPVFAERLELATTATPTARLDRIGDRLVALTDLELSGAPPRALRGATLEARGSNLHISVAGPASATAAIESVLSGVLASLDGQAPEPGAFGQTIEVPGVELVLPAGWRPRLPEERRADHGESCEQAVFPRAAAAPDWLEVCTLPLWLGIVDEHSFGRIEPLVRRAAFEDEPTPSGTALRVGEHLGFVFERGHESEASGASAARRASDQIGQVAAVVVVPHAAGATRFELIGRDTDAGQLRSAIRSATFDGPHPASLSDHLGYWLWTRPTPALTLLAGGFLAYGAFAMRRRSNPLDDLA